MELLLLELKSYFCDESSDQSAYSASRNIEVYGNRDIKTPRLKGSLDETKWIRTIDPQFRKLMLYPAEL